MPRYINIDDEHMIKPFTLCLDMPYRQGWNECLSHILSRKGEDVAPVRHGKWEECITPNTFDTYGNPDTYMKCSVCGFTWHDKYAVKKYFKGCPNCLAKMDLT